MAVFTFTSPNGEQYEVTAPEGATEAEAFQMLQSQIQPPSAQKAPAPATDRFLRGMRDPLDASAQLLTHLLPKSAVSAVDRANNWLAEKTGLVGKLPEGGLDQQIAESEAAYQAPKGVDWARLAGNIASPTNIAIASRLPQAASLAGRIATGAGAGAISGLTGTTVTSGNFADEKLKQTGYGAAGGAILSAAAAGVGRVVRPNTKPQVARLLGEGVTPTPGQMLGGRFQATEDKLTSVPILGDAIASARGKGLDELNRAAYDRALKPIGAKFSGPVGRDGISQVRGKLSEAYDALLPKVTFRADPVFAADIQKLQTMASSLPPELAKRFEKTLRDKVISKLGPRGTMDGEALKGVESELGELARGLGRDALYDHRQLGHAIAEIQTAIRSSLQRTNPAHAKELKAINSGYAQYAILRDAAARQGSLEGKFTASQLSAAVRATDRTRGKRAFSEGTALMQDLSDAGKGVLAPRYPDSGSAGRIGAGVLTGSVLGGGAYASPMLGGGALTLGTLSVLPYLPGGRQAMAALLARRPDGAKQVANAIRQLGPFAAPAGIPLLQPGQ